MSGHSHSKKIKREKAITDQKRGQMFSKIARMISVAIKEGGTNPETNQRLNVAMETAKKWNLPKENIERAIKKGSGEESAGEKLVSNKVQEKAELKQAVADANAQVSELKKQNETFAIRMTEAGIDTSAVIQDVNFSGPIWDEYQVYLKNGGTSDFEFYRLYKK